MGVLPATPFLGNSDTSLQTMFWRRRHRPRGFKSHSQRKQTQMTNQGVWAEGKKQKWGQNYRPGPFGMGFQKEDKRKQTALDPFLSPRKLSNGCSCPVLRHTHTHIVDKGARALFLPGICLQFSRAGRCFSKTSPGLCMELRCKPWMIMHCNTLAENIYRKKMWHPHCRVEFI